jgi:hypothetical protein
MASEGQDAVQVLLVLLEAACEEEDDEKKRSRLASRRFGRRESIT